MLVAGVSGCENQEGPAEEAGKRLDQSVESAEENYEETKDTLLDKDPVEQVRDSIDGAAETMADNYEDAKGAVEEKLSE